MDHILIVFDQNKTTENLIMIHMNNTHKQLEFKITEDENDNYYLDLIIHRQNTKLSLEIYRNPTQTDVTIHFTSNYPFKQKLAAFVFYIKRIIILPITAQAEQQEWNTTLKQLKTMDFHYILFTT